jgi:hypothetical protein
VSSDDIEFRILIESIGNRGRRARFINEVLRARRQAGIEPGSTTGRRGGPVGGRSPFARPLSIQPQPSVRRRPSCRRQARMVRHRRRAFPSAPLSTHVAYLERDGVTRDGEKGRMFGATEDHADVMVFTATRPQRPASFPLRRHAGGCRRDD